MIKSLLISFKIINICEDSDEMSLYSTRSDSELLESLGSGNEHAFEEIYNRYWERLYKNASNILRDEDQSTDVVQEIFISLWTKREVTSIDNLAGYLHRAVKFQIANVIRHQKIRESFFDEVKALSLRIENYDPYDQCELLEVLDKGVDDLPEKCRKIFELSRRENLSHKEIADRLGISLRTVENQISIALKRLRVTVSDFLAVALLLLSKL